jgi:glutamate synthase (NADPH/NADH) large chain/glutamate synthase (ferredoxin)
MGHYIYGWRQVPVDVSVIGEKANATRPEIEQILIRCEKARPRRVRARALHHPPPDREGGARGAASQGLLRLFAVAAGRSSTRA